MADRKLLGQVKEDIGGDALFLRGVEGSGSCRPRRVEAVGSRRQRRMCICNSHSVVIPVTTGFADVLGAGVDTTHG